MISLLTVLQTMPTRKQVPVSLFWLFPLIFILSHLSEFLFGLQWIGISILLAVTDYSIWMTRIQMAALDNAFSATISVIWLVAYPSAFASLRRKIENHEFFLSKIYRHIARSSFAICSAIFLFIVITLALWAPWLAPQDPTHQQDMMVTRYAKPFQSILYLKLKTSNNESVPSQSLSEQFTALQNKLIPPSKLFVDEAVRKDDQILYTQGIQKKTVFVSELITDTVERKLFILGTDRLGRDILARLIYGARISLAIGILAMLVAMGLGTLIGLFAGYFGGWSDRILMRFTDLMMAFPNLFLILLVAALFGNSTTTLILLLGATGWMSVSRLVRGQVLSVREMDYISAARASGLSRYRILFYHIFPNVTSPIIVASTLRIGNLILIEAGLSFLGVGIQPPTPSWGNMVSDGRDVLLHAAWISAFPALAITLTVIAFNILGDVLHDSLETRQDAV